MKENSSEIRYFFCFFFDTILALCVFRVRSPSHAFAAANISISHCVHACLYTLWKELPHWQQPQSVSNSRWMWMKSENRTKLLVRVSMEEPNGVVNKLLFYIYSGEWDTVPPIQFRHGACIILRHVHINHCPPNNFRRMDAPNARTTDTTEICLWVWRLCVWITFSIHRFPILFLRILRLSIQFNSIWSFRLNCMGEKERARWASECKTADVHQKMVMRKWIWSKWSSIRLSDSSRNVHWCRFA